VEIERLEAEVKRLNDVVAVYHAAVIERDGIYARLVAALAAVEGGT